MALIHKILVATDFSGPAVHALDYGAELAVTYSAPLLILHVFTLPVVAVPDGYMTVTAPDAASMTGKLHDGLHRAEARARSLGVAAVEYRLVEGAAWHEIVGMATAEGCDLIVMGTHGRSAVSHFLLGSVAEKVVRKASCPVLTVPPRSSTDHHPRGA